MPATVNEVLGPKPPWELGQHAKTILDNSAVDVYMICKDNGGEPPISFMKNSKQEKSKAKQIVLWFDKAATQEELEKVHNKKEDASERYLAAMMIGQVVRRALAQAAAGDAWPAAHRPKALLSERVGYAGISICI